ncbi:MAG: winged helix-turn-helix domain-containing protein [Candidatus Woesearchaeota archaeon]
MTKRDSLEIIRDILKVVLEHNNSIKPTPLLRKSNLSSRQFSKYFVMLVKKGFLQEIDGMNGRVVSLTDKGFRFLERYETITAFIKEFEL